MKLGELFLSFFLLFSFIFHAVCAPTTSQANALEKITVNFEGCGEQISLIDTFKDTPFVNNGEVNVHYFIKSNNPLREDAFTLPYQDFGYLCELILAKTIKYPLNGKVSKITVKGNSKQAKIVLTYTMDTSKKNFLLRLAGVKENRVDAVIFFDVDIEKKTVENSFEVKGLKISNFLLKTACKIIFGESDYEKLFDEMSQKLFWGLGNLSAFGENELIFE